MKTSFFDQVKQGKRPEFELFVKDEDLDLESSEIPQKPSQAQPESLPDPFTGFYDAIISVLGPLERNYVQNLYEKFKHIDDKVLMAIEFHLKAEESPAKRAIPAILLESSAKRKRTRGVLLPFAYSKNATPLSHTPNTKSQPLGWKRYLGTLFADAFTTRPCLKPLSYEQLLVMRSLKPKTLTGKERKKPDTAIIRLYLSNEYGDEREIGRLKEDNTRIFAPLLDLLLLECEVTVAMDTKRLLVGDGFFVQIHCYLTDQAFAWKNVQMGDIDLVKGARFPSKTETEGETVLRLRQHAISSLFSRLQVKALKVKNNQEYFTQAGEVPGEPEVVDLELDDEKTELSLDQLQTFYSENQQSEMLKGLPDTTKPPTENFSLELRGYQKLGLSWMLAREKELEMLKTLNSEDPELEESLKSDIDDLALMEEGVMNPLWKTFKWPKSESSEAQSDEPYFYGNMYSGELSFEKPLIKSTVKGGILADEMGLGKTISALALVNSVPYDTRSSFQGDNYANSTTLVIVPMSLLTQWKNEFEKANNNLNHKCIVYYGQQSVANLSTLLVNKKRHIPVLMITTYGTVLSEFARIDNRRDSNGTLPQTGLFSVKFFRIILDEGHQIRNRVNKTSRAIFELQLSRKWVLTGTPIINRLDDLYSIVKFLELEPWNNFSYWKMFITLPFEQMQVKQTLDIIKTILEPIFLRRTKNMKDSEGNPLVQLPPKEVVIEEVEFSEREAKIYDWFKDRAYKQFSDHLRSGELLKQYTQILTQILRLRQICCHQDLIKSLMTDMDEEFQGKELDEEELLKFRELIEESGDRFKDHTEMMKQKYLLYEKVNIQESECSICTNSPIDMAEMAVTPCGHTFCLNCVIEHIEYQNKNNEYIRCPNCRTGISMYKLFKVRNKVTTKKEFKFHTGKEVEQDFGFDLYLYDPTKVSSKLQALINHIVTLKDQHVYEPIIVFSQFSSYLDIIETELNLYLGEKSVRCLKFDGRLSEVQRQKLLQDFNNSANHPGKITVLLLSLKAGGVGLNLTNASRAFMMDPWWSPSIEDQAIDRLHRIGQSKNVKVIRFIMKNSIEINMLRIQERKKQLGEIVALEEEEKRKHRIEEIKMLFDE